MRIKNLRSVHFALFAALLLVTSCTFDRIEDLDPPPKVDFCDSAQVSFAADIIPILELNCSNANFNPGGSCHEAGSPIADYTIYAGVKAKVDEGKIQLRALNQQSMPPPFSTGPRPDTNQLKLLQCWIDAGALNN